MPIDTSLLPHVSGDVQVDENGDAYRICHRDSEEEELAIEWRFYFNGRSSQRERR
jgi:hypothetical protein